MTAAEEVLADRDDLTAVSARLGASTPNDLETPFEEATTDDALDDARGRRSSDRADVAER